jgi:hypothetical protein
MRALHVAAVDELVDLAVRVAGDVAEHRLPGRRLVQPVDRHHGNSCLIAQESGIDWNSEKLQKYVSASASSRP